MPTKEQRLSTVISNAFMRLSLCICEKMIFVLLKIPQQSSLSYRYTQDLLLAHKSRSPCVTIESQAEEGLERLAFSPHNTFCHVKLFRHLLFSRWKFSLFLPWSSNIIEPANDSLDRIAYKVDINWRRKVELCEVGVTNVLNINFGTRVEREIEWILFWLGKAH